MSRQELLERALNRIKAMASDELVAGLAVGEVAETLRDIIAEAAKATTKTTSQTEAA
ncbi:MAG TPA: hypothetical protein VGP07_13565 [Polyangia bacterium]|jgi:hypothetical protein